MLQNTRVTAFTISKLLRENQQGGDKFTRLPSPRLGLKIGDPSANLRFWGKFFLSRISSFQIFVKPGRYIYLIHP